MKLIAEHSDAVFDVPIKGSLYIGNDEDCQVQINRPEIWGRHAVINVTGYGYLLQVESTPIRVNGTPVKSGCMLYAGDELMVADLKLLLVDDEYIPESVNKTLEFDDSMGAEEISSVFGIRYLTGNHNGAFVKSGYQHADGWHIYRTDAKLALVTNNQQVYVNGRLVESAWLKNGDRIQYLDERFNVECPGHSGYSKFSPSHPRNVMLSEALTETETNGGNPSPWHKHYWWITLLIGLSVLTAVILFQ